MEIYDILKFTIPALLVLVTAWVLLDKQIKGDQRRRDFELQLKNQSTTTPLRLRAYERLVLVLERTTPTNMVVNAIAPSMNCLELQAKLLHTIREEFGHNASQQIYVSNELWTAMRSTQESLVKLVNMCASVCTPDMPASVLAEKMIEVYTQTEQSPGEVAAGMLKNEVRALL